MTEDQLDLMRIAARSVMAEADAGRSVDPQRLEWAQRVLLEPVAGDHALRAIELQRGSAA